MSKIDVQENLIKKIDEELLAVLLMDRSSGKNIIWATNDYAYRGEKYYASEQITVSSITGHNGRLIKPRVGKSKKEQQQRIKNKAEVFTPSWVCNKQNNLVDSDWFVRENVFNTETEKSWIANPEIIVFPEGKTWQDYVKDIRMEITCGEAPYLTSRYDTVTGEYIETSNRIGLLDRKLRVISENVDAEPEWVEWAYAAYKATYGFDYQGDNVLIARENLLFTFIEVYMDKFGDVPAKAYLLEITKILSWNIWQMDGLKFVIPNSCKPTSKLQISIFDDEEQLEECEGCKKGDNHKHKGIYCKVMNWVTKKTERFIDQLRERK